MKYISTRGQAPKLNFEDTLITGLAADGGLYVPQFWPKLSFKEIESFRSFTFQEIAFKVMKPYVGDTFNDKEFQKIIEKAYSCFSSSDVCPLAELSENHFMLELFHGPTLAFKDVAMQLIAHMFDLILDRRDQRVTIVAATSGDTGSAAMEAFRGSNNANLFILFPDGGVSDVQRRQMTTVNESNVHALSIKGDFDDCQSIVKQMFNDAEFSQKVGLTAVNSINWARVLAQTIYFFSSAASLGAPNCKVNFTVPTGNFGDIFAGYVAKQMGLPIDRLVIATNENDILHRTLQSGVYKKEGLVKTISPSMDIQVSSNFERLLFDLAGRNSEKIELMMNRLADEGSFCLGNKLYENLLKEFSSGRVNEANTLKTMKSIFALKKKLICPHTAVGIKVSQEDIFSDISNPIITLATAHASKFPDAVKRATKVNPSLPTKYADLFKRNERVTVLENSVSDAQKLIIERIGI